MSGVDFYEEIKHSPHLNNTHFTLLANLDNHNIVTAANEAGFNNVLFKPVMQYDLWNIITDDALKIRALMYRTSIKQVYPDGFDIVKGSKILIAEDNELNAQVASEILISEGFYIKVASNGKIAVEMALSETFDLILMDLQMPIMDGFEASRILTSTHNIKVPIVALSADAILGVKKRAFKAGACDYIAKPIKRKLLFAALAKYIKPRKRKLNPMSKKYNTSSANYEDLKEILVEFDVDEGIYRSNDNSNLYITLLSKFKSNYCTFVDDLVDFMDNGQTEEARKLVHMIKGVAGNISAKKLYNLLIITEESLKKEDSVSQSLIDDLSETTIRIGSQIEAFENKAAKAKKDVPYNISVDEIELYSKISELVVKLENFDTSAEEICASILDYDIGSKLTSKFILVSQLISDFEFNQAIDICNECLAGLKNH